MVPMLDLIAIWLGTALSSQVGHCELADRFLREQRGMAAQVEPDTIDDWRTRRRLSGCRVTAAGGTTRSLQAEAEAFYAALRSAGWQRTPDPRDAPAEASMRFRAGSADCLFNVYGDALLLTDAEATVEQRRPLRGREIRYHVYAMCTPALPAAPPGQDVADDSRARGERRS
jgi:hypothetical protein